MTAAVRFVAPAATPLTRPPVFTVALAGTELENVLTPLPWLSTVSQAVDEPSL
jgi:hypothetical protein